MFLTYQFLLHDLSIPTTWSAISIPTTWPINSYYMAYLFLLYMAYLFLLHGLSIPIIWPINSATFNETNLCIYVAHKTNSVISIQYINDLFVTRTFTNSENPYRRDLLNSPV